MSRWYVRKWMLIHWWRDMHSRNERRYFIRSLYTGIVYAIPYWSTPRWRRWLRDFHPIKRKGKRLS